jgi:hypothetical protein
VGTLCSKKKGNEAAIFEESRKFIENDELSTLLESGSFIHSLSSWNTGTVYPHVVEVGSVGDWSQLEQVNLAEMAEIAKCLSSQFTLKSQW